METKVRNKDSGLRSLRRLLVVLWVLLMLAVAAAMVAVKLSGWHFQVVQTDSMKPFAPRGSLVLIHAVDPQHVRVGDVVAFHPANDSGRTILHRISSLTNANGKLIFHTKGDANSDPDPAPITQAALVGRMGWHISHIGALALFLMPPVGPILLIGVPIAFIIISEVARAWGRHHWFGEAGTLGAPRPSSRNSRR